MAYAKPSHLFEQMILFDMMLFEPNEIPTAAQSLDIS